MNQSLEYTYTKDTAVVYKLRVKNGGIARIRVFKRAAHRRFTASVLAIGSPSLVAMRPSHAERRPKNSRSKQWP